MTVSLIKRTYSCAAVVFEATRYEPAEHCESDAEPGSDFCEGHNPDNAPEPDYDDQDFWIEQDWENDRYDDGDWM